MMVHKVLYPKDDTDSLLQEKEAEEDCKIWRIQGIHKKREEKETGITEHQRKN